MPTPRLTAREQQSAKRLTRPWFGWLAAAALTVVAITAISDRSSNTPAGSLSQPATSGHLAAADFSVALSQPGTIVLDVRTPGEYASGHLPEAQNVDVENPDFSTRVAALDKNANYVLYCRSGNRSNLALEAMVAAGFTGVHDLVGGIGAWQANGGPLASGGP